MANKGLFSSSRGKLVPPADTVNEAGGKAYSRAPKELLAVYASTGCLNGTYYADASEQLDMVLKTCQGLDDDFIARTAVYARRRAFMKDMPALLAAILFARKSPLLQLVFPKVIDNGRMLRNFVQIVRSGATGRKSLGTTGKRLVAGWINSRTPEQLFRDSVGQDPSLADVIKMVHPLPKTPEHRGLFAYLIGRASGPLENAELPQIVADYESWKLTREGLVPDVPFQMLTALSLGTREWIEIARNARWQMTRMNLNTFKRHGVFDVEGMTEIIADRLKDRDEVRRSRCFPYQLLMAYKAAAYTYKAAGGDAPIRQRYATGRFRYGTMDYHMPDPPKSAMPMKILEALQDAMEIAIENVPEMDAQIAVCCDVSGSMSSPVTGKRKGSTTNVRCVDVASLVTAAIIRRNRMTFVMPFDTALHNAQLNPRDTVMTNAVKLASFGGGGTSCSLPLYALAGQNEKVDLVVFVSDYESWFDRGGWHGGGTESMKAWALLKRKFPAAKMICIDINPTATHQMSQDPDIIRVAGFSDQVFQLIAAVAKGEASGDYWVGEIEKVNLADARAHENVSKEVPGDS